MGSAHKSRLRDPILVFRLKQGLVAAAPDGETKAGAQEAPSGGPLLAGHGFWTKEFILIELIAPELDWFQVCTAHCTPLPYTGLHWAVGIVLLQGIYSQRKTGRGGLGSVERGASEKV